MNRTRFKVTDLLLTFVLIDFLFSLLITVSRIIQIYRFTHCTVIGLTVVIVTFTMPYTSQSALDILSTTVTIYPTARTIGRRIVIHKYKFMAIITYVR